jgi:hypothetical protein
MHDLLQNPDDKIDTDPAELRPLFVAVMTTVLAKQLAGQFEKPWTAQQEAKLHEEIAALGAACNDRGLKTFKVIVTRPNGNTVVREMDVSRIAKTRSLQ